MRRATEDVEPLCRLEHPAIQAVLVADEAAVEARIAALSPLVTPDRLQTFERNAARRLTSLSVLMDSFHDPHNGAALVRTCDAMGLQTAHVFEPREAFVASRSVARGSQNWVDVHTHRSEAELFAAVGGPSWRWVATEPNGALAPEELGDGRTLLVLGNERDGISKRVRERCTTSVRVPMRGYAESLNVSVAGAILLYEATKGRAGDLQALEQRRLILRALLASVARSLEVLDALGLGFSLGAQAGAP